MADKMTAINLCQDNPGGIWSRKCQGEYSQRDAGEILVVGMSVEF